MARFRTTAQPLAVMEHAKNYEEEQQQNLINGPQKEPLRFSLDTSTLPPHLADLVLEIQRVAESNLFHWKMFPLNLPPPLAVHEYSEGHTASSRRKPLIVENLFNLPSWDDLDVVSVDKHGEPKHLSSKQLTAIRQQGYSDKPVPWQVLTTDQLHSIKETGSFTVASINFPGQHHTWRLSPLLQNGSELAWESLLYKQAWAAAMIHVVASQRFTGDVFSIKQSFNSIHNGIRRFLDLLFGMPSLHPRDFETRLSEERSRYLVAELLCAPECQEDYIGLCRFVRHLLVLVGNSGKLSDIHQQKAPPIPYMFQTPKGLSVDLRLFSREVMAKAKVLVTNVLQQESKARWSQQVHEIKRQDGKLDSHTSAGFVRDQETQDEALEHLWESLLNHRESNQFEPGIIQLLIDQARATIFMKKAVNTVREKFTADLIQAEVDIRLHHPLLSLVKPWMDKKLANVKMKLAKEYQWKCHEEAIEACRRKSLDQFVYFLLRDLTFLKERAPVLSKELWADQQPTRTYLWDTWIWNPLKWIVRRHFQGNTEVIATHMSATPTSIVNPRTSHGEHPQQPIFTLEKSSRRTTTTQWPLWRWANYLQRAWSWSWNAAYACGYLVPWCSPLSIRALVSSQPFYADVELSQVNGALCPSRSSYTPTFNSRLASLWRHISKSRTEFETKPDTGFMGKGLTRQINRIWNYGVKGLLCSLLLIIIFPILCVLSSAGGLCLAITAPLWAPVLALLYHIGFVFFYDVDNPNPNHNPLLPIFAVLGRDILINGLLQPIGCLIAALVICPIVALLISSYGLLHWMVSRTWDGFMFHVVIRPRGRIPASNSCLVKRIAGPGLNTEFFYQISKEQALAAFEARLESDRLIAYRRQTERLIRRPAEEFRAFVQQVFTPFSASWNPPIPSDKTSDKCDPTGTSNLKSCNVATQLERETQALLASLEEKVERRLYELRMPLPANILKKIRLSAPDLKLLLMRSAIMMREFYPTEILSRVSVNETELWERYNVEEGDWLALAAIFLSEIFSPAILNPLSDGETRIPLETKDVDLSRHAAMFTETTDMAAETPFEWPQQSFPSRMVPLPDFSFFSPLTRDAAQSSPPWKKKRTPQHNQRDLTSGSWSAKANLSREDRSGWNCELVTPLPIPHPVLICLLIYNRHRDVGAILLESEPCRLLLRWLEGSATPSVRTKEIMPRPPVVLETTTSRSPASHRPLLGSSGSDLALSPQPSIVAAFSRSRSPSSSPSQHDTLVSIAQDGTLSLVGTLVSEHASVDIDFCSQDQEQHIVTQNTSANETEGNGVAKGLTSTLARAADTIRVALLGEKAEEPTSSGGRQFSTEDFELLPSEEREEEERPIESEQDGSSLSDSKKKFPPYQPASFRSWRMNLPTPLRRYELSDSTSKMVEVQSSPLSPRPLGFLEMSSGLALDRGPAFSPAQLSMGRKLMENNGHETPSSSQDSLPFAEEDASLVESPEWDQSKSVALVFAKQDPPRATLGQPYCEMQTSRPSAILASIEDLSLSLESQQHTHPDIPSRLGTQV